MPVGGLPAPPSAIGGWNLDVHQTYDPVGRTLYGGDGSQAQRDRAELRLDPLRGRPPALTGARVSVELEAPEGLARAPDGALYIADTGANVIRKVAPDGAVSVSRAPATRPRDDAGVEPSTLAVRRLRCTSPTVAPTGSAGSAGGVITTVAGTGGADYNGDGGPALAATFDEPSDVAVALTGRCTSSTRFNHALRRIGPDGMIATALSDDVLRLARRRRAARPTARCSSPTPATTACVVLGADGTEHGRRGRRHRRLRGDGGPATDARLDRPSAVARGPTAPSCRRGRQRGGPLRGLRRRRSRPSRASRAPRARPATAAPRRAPGSSSRRP